MNSNLTDGHHSNKEENEARRWNKFSWDSSKKFCVSAVEEGSDGYFFDLKNRFLNVTL